MEGPESMRIWQVPNPVPTNTGELIGQAAPLADLSDWLMDPIERALFAVIQWLATGFWNLDRAFLNAAVQIYAWRNAITEPSGLIARLVQSLTTDPTLRNLIGSAFLLALLIVALLFGLRFLGSQ